MKQTRLRAAVNKLNESSPDVMSLSFLGRSDLPRGVRNNNPGNLTKTSIPWQGKIGNDGRFEKFSAYVWGVRAKLRDIKKDIVTDGQNTIRKLITEYAPANENNTSGYINTLSNYTGYDPDQILSWEHTMIKNLARGIARVENGNPSSYGFNQWISDEMFDAAWELAKY